MPKNLITDSSTIIALERAELHQKINKLNNIKIITPTKVKEELGDNPELNIKEKSLKGRSLKKVRELINNTGIDRGEAECLVLAKREDHEFIISDDRKLIRQRQLSDKEYLKDIKILGFSYYLHQLKKKDLLERNIWDVYEEIIKKNQWSRSEVYVANHTFLKEMNP